MKMNGKKLQGLNIEVLVIPRQSGDIVFKAQCVRDDESLSKLNPAPSPPVRLLPGGVKQENVEDPKFKERLNAWAERKFYWMVVNSLKVTEGLEWETVEFDNPETWGNYRTELEEAGFADGEIARIELLVSNACGLNQTKIDEATERFLAGQQVAAAGEFGPSIGQDSTPSGEPANASA